MKITLSSYDLWTMGTGLAMMIEQQEKGVKPGPEDANVILLNALLSLVGVLTVEGGFVVLETCPFPVNFKTEQGEYQLPEGMKEHIQAVLNQHQKGRETKP
jgi:hypothetical protein